MAVGGYIHCFTFKLLVQCKIVLSSFSIGIVELIKYLILLLILFTYCSLLFYSLIIVL